MIYPVYLMRGNIEGGDKRRSLQDATVRERDNAPSLYMPSIGTSRKFILQQGRGIVAAGTATPGGGCYRTAPLRENSRSFHTQADSLAIDARLAVLHRRRQARLCEQKQATGAEEKEKQEKKKKNVTHTQKKMSISRYPPHHTVTYRKDNRFRDFES